MKLLIILTKVHSSFIFNKIGLRISNMINLAIYDWTLKYNLNGSTNFNIGSMVNLI